MANRPFVHVEIPAADRQKAAEFYGKAFEWTFEHHGAPLNYTTFMTGNVGGGFPDLGDNYKPGDVILYVGSDDIEADLRKIESLGGKTVVPKMEIPETGWFAIFSDPTGNKLALFTPLPGTGPGGPS